MTYFIILLYFLISTTTILGILNSEIPTRINVNKNVKIAKSNNLSKNLVLLYPLFSGLILGIILFCLIVRAFISNKL